MENKELLEKNKTKLVNLGIILLALFIAFQLYTAGERQFNSLAQQKNDELKKNKISEDIAVLEKKVAEYKKVFTKKDMGLVMDTISVLAKNNSVKIVSIKPINEEVFTDYIKSSFLITVNISSYHSLGNFISQIESSRNIFLIGEVTIAPSGTVDQFAENPDINLNVNLKVSTIASL